MTTPIVELADIMAMLRAHYVAGDKAAAAAAAEAAVRKAPADAGVLRISGRLEWEQGRLETAVDRLARAAVLADGDGAEIRRELDGVVDDAVTAVRDHWSGKRLDQAMALARLLVNRVPHHKGARAVHDIVRQSLADAQAARSGWLEPPLRIKVVIPHYYATKESIRPNEEARFQTVKAPDARANALRAAVVGLHANFGAHHYTLMMGSQRFYREEMALGTVDIAICTVGRNHVLDRLNLPPGSYTHAVMSCEPLKLGFAAQRLLLEGDYDYYCFCEDDIIIGDPHFFHKLAWFNRHFTGQNVILQPNRYEIATGRDIRKVYVDGGLLPVERSLQATLPERRLFTLDYAGRSIVFDEPYNRHSGCFFLTREQRDRYFEINHDLEQQPYYVGPLETAASVGIMRAFSILKPAGGNKDFLQVEHGDARFAHFVDEWQAL